MDKKIIVSLMCFILIWISYFFQVSFLSEFPLFGVKPNVAIVVTVGIALLSGKIPGMLFGMGYGLTYDIFFGKSMGLYFALYGLLGFLLGSHSNGFSKENRLSVVLVVAIVTAVVEVVTYLSGVVLYGYEFEVIVPGLMIVKEAVYNMILARIVYGLLVWLAEIINKCKNSYYLL